MNQQKFVSHSELKEWLSNVAPGVFAHRGKTCVFVKDPDEYYYTTRKLSLRGVDVREGAHRVVLLMKLRLLQFPEGCEASHLCGKKGCLNKNHIVAEPHHVNISRKTCHKRRKQCSVHVPKCIKHK